MINPNKINRNEECGAALLLTLLVLSLLIVLVGQFSYSVVLDRKVAMNYVHDAQVSLDIFAGVKAAAGQLSQEGIAGSEGDDVAVKELLLGIGESEITAFIQQEDSKLNLNSLLNPPQGVSENEMQQVVERMLKAINTGEIAIPDGLAADISQYLNDKGVPALTLLELTQIQGITEKLLFGSNIGNNSDFEDAFPGLSKYFTVWSDGLIDYRNADEKLLLSLDAQLNPGILDVVLKTMENPGKGGQSKLQNLANRLDRFVKSDSSFFSAVVQSKSGSYARRCMTVFQMKEGTATIILWDELEPLEER